MHKTIVVIPARGGSKSIPRKNLQLLLGIPLLAYSIDVGNRLRLNHEVIVSTDDSQIAEVSKRYGAEVIYRPANISDDNSRDYEMILHILKVKSNLSKNDIIVFLRPTHPIRNPEIIEKAYAIFIKNNKNFDSLRSMKLSNEIVYKTWCIDNFGKAVPAFNDATVKVFDPVNAPRQILPKTYYQDGYVDIFSFSTILKYSSTSGKNVLPFIIEDYSKDIDTFEDLAEVSNYLESNKKPIWFQIPSTR